MVIRKYQEGGSAPQEQIAPQQEQDPIMVLAQASQEALQNQDCEMAMQVCQAFLQLVQEAAGAQEQQAPMPQEGEQPVFKCGGKISRTVKKSKKKACGGKMSNGGKC